MCHLRIKSLSFLFVLLTSPCVYGQLSLEDIFLTDKYKAKQAEDITFLHTKPAFAALINVPGGKNIAFYNDRNEKTGEWKIAGNTSVIGIADRDLNELSFSPNDTYFLVGSGCERPYRRSLACSYFIGNENGISGALSSGKQFFPQFSPDDTKVAFVEDNNLFYKNIHSGEKIQITNDGKWNFIINGKSDWVYEEEFELTRAFEWNARGDKIAYLKFDESSVKAYSIPMYYDMQYPNLFSYKYPKVGEENSKVSVWMYDLKSRKNRRISLPFSYEYIPRLCWNAGGDEIIAMLMDRHQDSLRLAAYNIKTKKTRSLYLETGKTYVEVPFILSFLSDNSFLINSEKDGYKHLYHYDKDGHLLKQLTTGNYEVKKFYGADEKNKKLFYQSNEGNELETAVYSLNYETLDKKKLSSQEGSNDAVFSHDFSFFLQTYSSASTPPQFSLQGTEQSSLVMLENNKLLADSLKPIPQKEFLKIPLNGYYLNAWMIRPANTDSTQKHPLLLYVYGGPGNQQVLNEWPLTRDLFFNYLASRGYAVAYVDNRGTGGRGATFKNSTFLQLGKYESEDQLLCAGYFGRLPYIDSSRIGIFGWSYGAFLSSLCLFEGNDIFKAAIAIGPVSDWNLYDDIYTERYMHTPAENPAGYHQYNPLVAAKKLEGKLLLIHSTADDNVHFQQSLFLINALNDAHKTYNFYVYPDKEHSIYGRKTRYDLFYKMEQFLKEQL